MVGYFYELTGDRLVLTPATGEEGETLKYTIQLDGDSLTLKGLVGDDKKTLRRVSTEAPGGEQARIVGTWSFEPDVGVTGYYVFLPDRRLLFQIPLPGKEISQYSVEGDMIVLRRGTTLERMRFEISDDTLTLYSEDGKKEYQYKRLRIIE